MLLNTYHVASQMVFASLPNRDASLPTESHLSPFASKLTEMGVASAVDHYDLAKSIPSSSPLPSDLEDSEWETDVDYILEKPSKGAVYAPEAVEAGASPAPLEEPPCTSKALEVTTSLETPSQYEREITPSVQQNELSIGLRKGFLAPQPQQLVSVLVEIPNSKHFGNPPQWL